MPEAYVYIHLDEGPVPAGILETAGTGREAGARFRYGRRYLHHIDEVFPYRLQKLFGEPALHKEWRQKLPEVDHASA